MRRSLQNSPSVCLTIDLCRLQHDERLWLLTSRLYNRQRWWNDSDAKDLADPSEDATSSEGPLTEYLPTHSRCYAHSLQLVVQDGLKDASQHLKNVIAKASNTVNHVRKPIYATDILEDEKRLQAGNATRWNSQLRMIRSVLGAPEEKLKQLDI